MPPPVEAFWVRVPGSSLRSSAQTTPYWVEDRAVSPGVQATGGKSAPGTGSYSSVKQYMYFDANEPFELVSFDVQANSYGKRYFVLFDVNGNQIAEKYAEIPVGTSTVTVNWKVPAGLQHRITAYDENSDVVRDLWRDNAGVSYPYPLGTLGSITGSSAGAQYYYYLYNWVVRTEDVVAVGPRTMVNAIVNSGPSLQAKVVLGGPFDGGTGLMSDAVRADGLVPLMEPYTALGFAQVGGGGGETTTPAILAATGSNAIVDWVRIELRSTLDPANVVATRQALVQRDGDIVSSDGASTITFAVAPGNYHVAVRHRNHLGCMTSTPLSLSSTTTVLDMSSSSTTMWGAAARKDVLGTMVLWSGNVFGDTQLRYTGANNDRDPILNIIGGVIPTSTVSGYLKEDANLDGAAKYTGAGNDRDVILNNLSGGVPTATRTEQLP